MSELTRYLGALAAAVVLLGLPANALCQKKEAAPSPAYAKKPILRFVLSAVVGSDAMDDKTDDRGNKVTWNALFGAGLELSLAADGLTPLLQAGYLIRNGHFFHAIPIDLGGRYVWSLGSLKAYLSGGMSILTLERKTRNAEERVIGDWEVNPLVFIEVGVRKMLGKHIGIELRLEYRTYIVINQLGLRLGLVL